MNIFKLPCKKVYTLNLKLLTLLTETNYFVNVKWRTQKQKSTQILTFLYL